MKRKQERMMSEAEKAAAPKKSKWATMVEVSANINRKRDGKTQKDHKSGAWKRNKENVFARGSWSGRRGTGGKGVTHGQGPALTPTLVHTLGGKGNSSKALKVCGGLGLTQEYRGKKGRNPNATAPSARR